MRPQFRPVVTIECIERPAGRTDEEPFLIERGSDRNAVVRSIIPSAFSSGGIQRVDVIIPAADVDDLIIDRRSSVNPVIGFERPSFFPGCRIDSIEAAIIAPNIDCVIDYRGGSIYLVIRSKTPDFRPVSVDSVLSLLPI